MPGFASLAMINLDTADPAGLAAFYSQVLGWDDVLGERSAWDTFVWYGAIYQMARALGDAGVSKAFAQAAGGFTFGASWAVALLALLAVYLYAHYAFATITAHVSAMFVPSSARWPVKIS